ncbi:MAG: FlgD immunoglobulin-like domain containing protein [Fibrobacterota bacterium]
MSLSSRMTAEDLIGKSDDGTASTSSGNAYYIMANRFPASTTYSITQMHIKLAQSGVGTLTLAVYADDFGAPGALLGTTEARNGLDSGWQTFTLTSPVALNAGQNYWLAKWGKDEAYRVSCERTGTLRYRYMSGSAWPDPYGMEGTSLATLCLYATGYQNPASRICSTPPWLAIMDSLYTYEIQVAGSPAPTIAVSGQPPWLTLNGNTLSGVPTVLGNTGPITVTATNTVSSDTQTFSISVYVQNTSLPVCYPPLSTLPGMGDHMFTMHWDFQAKEYLDSFYIPSCTPDRMRQIMQGFQRYSNGMPFAGRIVSMEYDESLRACMKPYMLEDTRPPWGDGTVGSGYRMFQELSQYAKSLGGSIGFFMNPNLASQSAQIHELVPPFARSLDPSGNWKMGWEPTQARYVSLKNMWDHIEQNGRSYLLNMYDTLVTRWGADAIGSIHFDYYLAAGSAANQSTSLGGNLTSSAEELHASDRLLEYLWTQYGISSSVESVDNTLVSPYSFGSMLLNSPLTTDRINSRFDALGKVEWAGGLEYLKWVDRDVLRTQFYKYMLVYQYNQKTRNFSDSVQDGVTLYSGGDRFVPQVGAGCRIIAYSQNGSNRNWTLPSTWQGITSADVYSLSVDSDPVLLQSDVSISGSIPLTMSTDKGYVVVPHGVAPTPMRARFDDLQGGDVLADYQGITWNVAGNPVLKVRERVPGGVSGGMGTLSMYFDDAATSRSASLTLPPNGILHSVRVGNKGGTGTVTIHSSNSGNPDASFSLPVVGQTEFIETNWQQPETGNVTITVVCSNGATNVLFDDMVYGDVDYNVRLNAGTLPFLLSPLTASPNPFNPEIILRFGLDKKVPVTVKVFDIRGKRVRTLMEGEQKAGLHVLRWNGRDDVGRSLSSGVYMVRLVGKAREEVRRIQLIK